MRTEDTTTPASPDETPSRLKVSGLVLVLANLVPVYGVLALGWDVFPVMLLFWLENVVVGVLNVLRLLVARPQEGASWAAKVFIIPFFCLHYGIFTLVHGVFVFVLFSGGGVMGDAGPFAGGDPEPFPTSEVVRESISALGLGIPLVLLTVSHLFSFVWNFLLGGEYRRNSLQEIMFRPYGRIVVLHLAILIGGFLAMSLGSPVWALLLLIGLKIGLDVKGHLRTHRRDGTPTRSGEGES